MTKKKKRTRSPVERPAVQEKIEVPTARTTALLILGLIAVLGVYIAHCAYYWAYVNDDAYITFRYSRFLSMGRGPYFNLGEHVEGYTNFLLMLILTPIIGLFGEGAAAPFAKALDIAFGALALIAAGLLVWRVDRTTQSSPARGAVAAILAAGMVAVFPAYALNSTSGLETMLLAGTLTLGLLLGHLSLVKKRWCGAGIAFACAALTRPEGVLFFAIYWFAQFVLVRRAVVDLARDLRQQGLAALKNHPFVVRVLLIDALVVSGVFAAHLVFRLIAYDGEWLPNTYYAKAGGFWKVDAGLYIGYGAMRAFFDIYGIGVSIAVMGWLFSGATRRASLPLFCVAAAGALLPFVTGTDWMLGWRLLMPFLPAIAGIVAIGWCRIASFVLRQPRALGPLLLLACLPLLWYLHRDDRNFFKYHIEVRAYGYQTGHTALAEWLRGGAAKKGDTVALMDIGIVGYLCTDQDILDITGLTDRTIAKSAGSFMHKDYDPDYVFGRKPEFIVLVFGADGNPTLPPPPGTRLTPWTKGEGRFWNHPEFAAHYVRHGPVPTQVAHWAEGVAIQLGAERIFEHAHPGKYYLLAVFRRSEIATTSGPAPSSS